MMPTYNTQLKPTTEYAAVVLPPYPMLSWDSKNWDDANLAWDAVGYVENSKPVTTYISINKPA